MTAVLLVTALLPGAAAAATVLGTQGCAQGSSSVQIGLLLPGAAATTTQDCVITFGSNDNTAMMHVSQADGAGSAMFAAGNGTLDSTFGSAGLTATSARGAGGSDAWTAVASAPQGGFYAVGSAYTSGTDSDLQLAKLLPDGSLDTSFNPGGAVPGIVTTTLAGSVSEELSAVAVQPDGKIVVGGHMHPTSPTARFLVARYNTDGSLDPTFNTSGTTPGTQQISFVAGNDEQATSLIIQPDGKILISGESNNGYLAVARLNIDGGLDSTFGAGGRVYRRLNGGDTAEAMALQPDGKILLAGTTGGANYGVDRLLPDGSVDTTFGAGTGYISDTVGAAANHISTIAVLPSGGILVAGTVALANSFSFITAYTASGVVDTSFGTAGTVTMSVTADSMDTSGLLVLPDSSTYLYGTVFHASSSDEAALWHISANGVPDGSFGTAGLATYIANSGNDDTHLSAAVLDSDGRPLTVGIDVQGSAQATRDLIALRWSSSVIPDYAGGTNWAAGANGMFGICLRGVTGAASAIWSATGACGTADTDPWQAVPATGSQIAKVAATTVSGVTDAAASLRFGTRITSTNRPGSYTAPIVIDVVAPNLLPPALTAVPTIAGTAATRRTLTATTGTFSGTGPLTYTYQWQSCAPAAFTVCTNIAGATATRYVVQATDVGNQLRVVQIAANGEGTAAGISVNTATVIAAPTTGMVYATGFEHATASVAGSGIFTGAAATTAPTFPTSLVRNGARSMRCQPSASTCSNEINAVNGATIVVSRFAISIGALPSADEVVYETKTSAAGKSMRVGISSTGQIFADGDNNVAIVGRQNGPTLALNQWYVIDLRVTLPASTTWTTDWSVDGVAQTQMVTTATMTASQTATLQRIGVLGQSIFGAGNVPGNVTGDVAFDDLAISTATTDYPIGPGKALGYVPSLSGTHVNPVNFSYSIDNGTTPLAIPGPDLTTHLLLTDWPIDSSATATALLQSANDNAGFLDYQLGDSAEASPPDDVRALIARQASGGANSPQNAWLLDGATPGVVFNGVENSVVPTYRAANFRLAPSGGAWTLPKFNALKFQFGKVAAVGANLPRLDAVLVEANYPTGSGPQNSTLPTIIGNPHVGLVVGSTTGTWDFAPSSYAYQWFRCSTAGTGCSAIPSATASTYTAAPADQGLTLRVAVIATNAAGSQVATSAQSALVGGTGPTLVWASGFESGTVSVASGAAGSLSSVSGAGTESTPNWPARTGKRSLEIATNAGGAGTSESKVHTKILPAGSVEGVARVAFMVRNLPPAASGNVHMTAFETVTCDCRLGRMSVNSAGQLLMKSVDASGNSLGIQNGPVIVANRWYVLDEDGNINGSTWTTKWSIDGVNQPTSVATNVALAADTVGTYAFGTDTSSTDYRADFDDVAISETAADYPLGNGKVVPYVPFATGAIATPGGFGKSITGGAPFTALVAGDANVAQGVAALLDEWPANTSGLVQQTNTLSTMRLALAPSTEQSPTDGVMLTGAHREAATGANNVTLKGFIGGPSQTAYSLDPAGGSAADRFYAGMLANPAGGAWTTNGFNSLQLELSSTDIAPVPWTDALLAEADYPTGSPPVNTVASTISWNSSIPRPGTTLSTSNGSWTAGSMAYSYQWLQCDVTGVICSPISSATNSTYVLQVADVGKTVRSAVSADNGNGSQMFVAAATPTISSIPTLVFNTGMETGTVGLTGDGLWNAVSPGTTIDTAIVRHGTYSLKNASTASSDNAERQFPGMKVMITRMAIYLDTLPSGGAPVHEFKTGSGSQYALLNVASSGKLSADFYSGGGIGSVNGPTIGIGTWHVVEMRFDITDPANWMIDWRGDGIPQTSTSWNATLTDNIVQEDFGYSATVTGTSHFDDIASSNTATDYPIGDGQGIGLRPNSAGIDSGPGNFQNDDLTGASGASFARLSESPFVDALTFVQQVTVSAPSYLEFGMADTPLTSNANGIYGLVGYHSSSGTANAAATQVVRADNTALTLLSGNMAAGGTALQWGGAPLAASALGWTPSEVNALRSRVGFATNVGSFPAWDGLLLEADYPTDGSFTATPYPTPLPDVPNTANSGGNSFTVNKPAGTLPGMVMIAGIALETGSSGASSLAGWTLLRSSLGTNNLRLDMFYKVAGGAEPASYTFSLPTTEYASGGIISFAGSNVTPIDVIGAAATSWAAPSITTGVINTTVVGCWANIRNSSTPPAGMTEQFDNTSVSQEAIACSTEARPTAGATGTRTETSAGADPLSMLVSIQP